MSRIESQVELFRGQIEELQGKMQQTLGQLEGARGTVTVLRGRGLEMRGRARQAVARARMGATDLSETFQASPGAFAPYGGMLVLGLAVVALAVVSPQSFGRIWEWLQGRGTAVSGAANQT